MRNRIEHPKGFVVGALVFLSGPLARLLGTAADIEGLVALGERIGPRMSGFLVTWGWAISVPVGVAILFWALRPRLQEQPPVSSPAEKAPSLAPLEQKAAPLSAPVPTPSHARPPQAPLIRADFLEDSSITGNETHGFDTLLDLQTGKNVRIHDNISKRRGASEEEPPPTEGS